MSNTCFVLPSQYVQHIAGQMARMGVALPDWLQQLQRPGLGGELEIQQLSFDDFRRLVREAIALTGESAFGLLVGERLLLGSHGLLGYAAVNSMSLRQALQFTERYFLVRTSLFGMSLVAHGTMTRVVFSAQHPLGDIRVPVTEAVVLTIKNLVGQLARGMCRVSSVSFPFGPPAHASLAHDLFGCDIRYGSDWAGFELATEHLDFPLRTGNPEALREAELLCQQELAKLTRQQTLSAQVRRLMLEKQGNFPTLQVSAYLLHMTPRTLHRRLQEEGTSYRDLLKDVRHRLAVEHIKAGKLTLQEVAFMLGYDEPSNFRRAFKRWEGVAPSAWRAYELSASGDITTARPGPSTLR